MNTVIEKKTEELIQLIKESDDYQVYRESLEKIEEKPGLRQRIDQFRTRTFRMYHDLSGEELFYETDRIERENQELRRIPEVNAFLDAEISLCRLLKETEDRVSREINFQLPQA